MSILNISRRKFALSASVGLPAALGGALSPQEVHAATGSVPGLNAFVDISHLNTEVDLPAAKVAGLAGLIHKATQHTDFVDPQYVIRIQEAKSLGLLVGAYHFASAAPVQEQVDFFLKTLDLAGREQVLPCLDWEPNPTGAQGNMSKDALLQFIDLFYKATGRYPVIYGGYWMLGQLGALNNPAQLGALPNCPLWQGFYSSAFGYLSDIWSNWTLLQYTDGTLGPEPHRFPGITGPVDRDTFNGTPQEAAAFWRNHALA